MNGCRGAVGLRIAVGAGDGQRHAGSGDQDNIAFKALNVHRDDARVSARAHRIGRICRRIREGKLRRNLDD